MKKRLKKTATAMIALLMGLSVCTSWNSQGCSALQYQGTASYMSGKYYESLKNVGLTGDGRTDILNIARSQVGYQEGGSSNQLSGQVYGGVNFTEYGAWYGVQDMWCAMFVSWCAHVAGISKEVILPHAFTPTGLQWFANRGQAYSREEIQAGVYTPRPGDLVYFKSSRNTRTTNHVGLVSSYGNGWLYTIEGNVGAAGVQTNGGAVVEKAYPITNGFIVYVCAPNYEVTGTSVLPSYEETTIPRSAVTQLESGTIVGYDTVGTAQGVSLGVGQWSGGEAIKLLTQIQQEDPQTFALLDRAGIGKLLGENQLPDCKEEKTIACLKEILSSHAGVQVQEKMLYHAMTEAMNFAQSQGVQDLEAQQLCAAVEHLGGRGTVRRCIALAQEDLSKTALLAALEQADPDLFQSCRKLNNMEGYYV